MSISMSHSMLPAAITSSLQTTLGAGVHSVDDLQILLGVNTTQTDCAPQSKPVPSVKQVPKTRTTQLLPKENKNAKTSTKSKGITIFNPSKDNIRLLPVNERRRVATETFNATLKHLAAAAKAKNCKETTAENKSAKKPLQPCSPNKQRRTPAPKSTQPPKTDDNGVVIDCAIIALDCLRQLGPPEHEHASDHEQRREMGAVILIEKLISLNETEKALIETSKIHDQYWKRRIDAMDVGGSSCNDKNGGVSLRLRVPNDVNSLSDAELNLLTSYQSQILRLAISSGSGCVNDEFAEDAGLTSQGSPANVILHSLKVGRLNTETAGQKLRIIGQALLKLYSVSITEKSVQPCRAANNLRLLVEAIAIKSKSWTLLKHQADIDREAWSHVAKGLKRLDAECIIIDKQVAKLAIDLVYYLNNTLELQGHGWKITTSVVNAVTDIAEKAGSYVEGLDIIHRCSNTLPLSNSETKMLYAWRMAVLQYKLSTSDYQPLVLSIELAVQSITKVKVSKLQNVEDVLLHGAKLRKISRTVFHDIAESVSQASEGDQKLQLSELCRAFLLELARLLFSLLHYASERNELGHCNLICTGFARTFEALIEIGACSASSQPGKCCYANFTELVDAANKMLRGHRATLTQEVVSFTENLLVRGSSVFWHSYLEQDPTSVQVANTRSLLKLSCSALETLSSRSQDIGSYGIKLERLAISYLSTNDVVLACKCFENAIQFYTKCGALKQATEAALSGPSSSVWSRKGCHSYSLGKALVSLAKLRLTYGVKVCSAGTWIYDDNDCSAIERCLLFQVQMEATTEHAFSDQERREYVNRVQNTLALCCETRLQVYRLRLVSQLLRCASKNVSLHDGLLKLLSNTDTTVPLPKSGNEMPLASYAASLHHVVTLQTMMIQDPIDLKRVSQTVELLSKVILGLNSLASIELVVDDVNLLMGQLQSVVSYCHMLDDCKIMMDGLLCMKHILGLTVPAPSTRLADVLTRIAILHHRLGDSVKAGKFFGAAEQVLIKLPEAKAVRGMWLVSHMQYLLDISNVAMASKDLEEVANIYETTSVNGDMSGREKVLRESFLSKSTQIASQIAFQNGNLSSAIQFARQSVRVSLQIWQTIERPRSQCDSTIISINESSLQSMTEEMSSLSLGAEKVAHDQRERGSFYWDQVDLLCSTLHHIINISVYVGLHQDAMFYADYLRKVARASTSSTRMNRASAISAFVQARAGHVEQAQDMVATIPDIAIDSRSLENLYATLYKAEALVEIGKLSLAREALDVLDTTQSEKIEVTETLPPAPTGVKKPAIRGKARSARPIKAPPKRAGKQTSHSNSDCATLKEESPATLAYRHLREKSRSLRSQIDFLESSNTDLILQTIGSIDQSNSCEAKIIYAMTMLHQALRELSSDAVKCVLAETAVALPVRYRSSRKSGRVSFVQSRQLPSISHDARSRNTIKTISKVAPTKREISAGDKLILDAQKLLRSLQNINGPSCATDMLHVAHKIQSKLALLSSAMEIASTMSSSEVVLHSLSSKDMIHHRERLAIHAERATRERSQLHCWPDVTTLQSANVLTSPFECSADDLASIPESWSIISISLSDDQTELLLSKITRNRSPFLLRVPLSRSENEVDGAEDFTFIEAKAELAHIVEQANLTAHDSRGQGDRESRKAWYAEREELDQRLENWLLNIESIWLGGFRGLMSPHTWDDDMLAKFGHKLNHVLDRHLPSRQKNALHMSNKVALHAHVLEMFLGLGHPDEQELDDAATDLLYFVVDILQFSGERNAYDEIDFDAMLVEVFDAMRAFHHSSLQATASQYHTILVVDKELAMFPWESLSCLRAQSVSRMASLSSIIQRLKRMREQSSTAQAYTIPSDQGAYILNPSSDLASTQSTFQPILQSNLPSYTSKVNSPPSESEFTSLLTNNPLLLYFGHGSGAQYIRGRTIRNLDHCAVTFLMGCSSAKMVECGKFESYGMPGYYVGAGMSGCMALVGTLWDVTDRDIDRFALRTLVEWGLIDGGDSLVKKALEKSSRGKGSGKGKAKVVYEAGVSIDDRRGKGKVTLDEAVMRGRDACLLRFLNGAAPVVYGVPVLLS